MLISSNFQRCPTHPSLIEMKLKKLTALDVAHDWPRRNATFQLQQGFVLCNRCRGNWMWAEIKSHTKRVRHTNRKLSSLPQAEAWRKNILKKKIFSTVTIICYMIFCLPPITRGQHIIILDQTFCTKTPHSTKSEIRQSRCRWWCGLKDSEY